MKNYYLLILCILMLTSGFGQTNFWRLTDQSEVSNLELIENQYETKSQLLYSLNFNALKQALSTAPRRGDGTGLSNLVLDFPDAYGNIKSYRVYEAPVIDDALSAQYPDIKSYVGVDIRNGRNSIRFSTTIHGFHGMILSTKGTQYINPHTKNLLFYGVFSKNSVTSNRTFECLFDEESVSEPVQFSPKNINQTESNAGIFRTYRLALASTEEYSQFHINAAGLAGGTLAQRQGAVLAAMNVTMTRVNGIYERDMSLTMVIIANNTPIIFVNPGNPDTLNNDDGFTLLNQIQAVIDGAVGSFSYDIGHVFSTGGGGIAQLNSPCTSTKARGVTGLGAPVGDPFDVDYVAHEMGHQYGATHTQNNNCQRSSTTAVEPGSASTILGYAGICAPNVQSNSDAHFHAVSLAQMEAFVNSTGSCSSNILNSNPAPVIAPIGNFVIPAGTPFRLRATATDANNNNTLTYCWEQTNNQVSTQPPSPISTQGPNFRSLTPSASPDRFMPNLNTILTNTTQNTWEVVPFVSRTMNFAVTVRDNNLVSGGQTARANTTVNTVDTGSPFTVTSQATSGISWAQNSTQTITWNVAGTNNAPINTQFVNILLSLDGGQTFGTTLAQNVPNNGSYTFTVPNITAQSARIMIEAVGNIFLAVNQVPFSIGINCLVLSTNPNLAIPDGLGANLPGAQATSTITVNEAGNINLAEFKVGLNISHTWIGDLVISLAHPDGTSVTLWNRNCNNPQNQGINATFQNGAPAIVCATPTVGNFSPFGSLAAFANKPINGTWTLRLQDFYNGDIGTLNSWSLDFGCTLSEQSFANNLFSVYPNPNKGVFNINFKEAITTQSSIKVYDMSGRIVFQKQYQSLMQEQTIDLGAVQQGVYLVEINNNDLKQTQKIIVK